MALLGEEKIRAEHRDRAAVVYVRQSRLPGRLPAYVTPGQYEANVARMAANRQTAATPGSPRDGSALLSGLLRRR